MTREKLAQRLNIIHVLDSQIVMLICISTGGTLLLTSKPDLCCHCLHTEAIPGKLRNLSFVQ